MDGFDGAHFQRRQRSMSELSCKQTESGMRSFDVSSVSGNAEVSYDHDNKKNEPDRQQGKISIEHVHGHVIACMHACHCLVRDAWHGPAVTRCHVFTKEHGVRLGLLADPECRSVAGRPGHQPPRLNWSNVGSRKFCHYCLSGTLPTESAARPVPVEGQIRCHGRPQPPSGQGKVTGDGMDSGH